ncbi:MAG: hypothetical protein AB7G11_08315 [Phycisphaerales bacterium]
MMRFPLGKSRPAAETVRVFIRACCVPPLENPRSANYRLES